MQASAVRVVLLPLFLALSSCASMDARTARDASEAAVGPSDDQAYVSRVEQIARQRGITVVWVNPPRKPAVPPSEAPP